MASYVRVGNWLPKDIADLEAYVIWLVREIYGTANPEKVAKIERERGDVISPLLPPVKALKDRIATDAKFNLYFNTMFTQVPWEYMQTMQVRNYEVMLRVVNFILTMPPVYTQHHVGCPINAILTWPMGTVSGYAAFLDDDVNKYLKSILSYWKTFLQSEASTLWLNETPKVGWFSPEAMKETPHFVELYKCDPSQPHYGFTSWDGYFTREFRDGVRPVASPNDNKVIVNACESAPYKLKTDVKATDTFWLKSQNYCITFMLANDPLAVEFVGGTVYQGFLSNLSYHRWHSPVNGTIVKSYLVDGGFYTECRAEGYDGEGDNLSQGYLTEVQTRYLIFIQADNPYIGLMCFIAVGMGDVSSCEGFVKEKQKVNKGDQIGTFHIGGSTHCLVFRPGVDLTFDLRGQTPSLDATNIDINSKIATVPQ